MKTKNSSLIKFIISNLLFGFNGIVASFISLDSYEIVLFRTMLGSLLLVAVFLLARNKFTFIKHKKDLLFLFISGVSMGASWMFLYKAYSLIGVSIATLCYYLGPIIVIILSPFIFKEKITLFKVLGVIAVLLGIVFLNFQAFNEEFSRQGIIYAILSAFTYSSMVIFNKKTKEIKGLENSTLQLIISFLTVGTFIVIRQGFYIDVSSSDIIPILIIGLVGTGIGCYLYFSTIGELSAQKVSIFGYIEPLSAIIFSAIILGEVMSPIQIVGAVLIIGGAIFAECYGFFIKKTPNPKD